MLKRAVLLTNIPAPYRTGLYNLIGDSFKSRGIDFIVLYCAKIEPNRDWVIDLDAHRYPYKILPGFLISVMGLYAHVNPTVCSEIKKLSPDVLIVGGSWNIPSIIFASFFNRAKKIFWYESHEDSTRYKRGIVSFLRKSILSMFGGFAVPNERSKQFIESQGVLGKDFLLLRNTVDDEFWGKIGDASVIRNKYGIPVTDCVFMQVSRLEDLKGVRELVKSFVMRDDSHSWLFLIGSGSLEAELKLMTKDMVHADRVIITGGISPNEVKKHLDAADVFVLNTKIDPNPLVVIEAAHAGKPLLISRLAGNAYDLVSHNENGLVLESYSPEYLCDVFSSIMVTPKDVLNLWGAKSKEMAKEKFIAERVADNFVGSLVKWHDKAPDVSH